MMHHTSHSRSKPQRFWHENRVTIMIVGGIVGIIFLSIQYSHLSQTQTLTETIQKQQMQINMLLQQQQLNGATLATTPTQKTETTGTTIPDAVTGKNDEDADEDYVSASAVPTPLSRSILRTPDGRTMPDFETWLASDAASGPVPVATWLDSCAASLSVESSIAELFASKRAAWSLVGDDYLWYGAGRTVLLHVGFLVHYRAWAEQVRSHAVAYSGEWIMLADVCASLCALGYRLEIAHTQERMDHFITPFTNNDPTKPDYDWIFTDYIGLGKLAIGGFYPWSFQDRSSMWGANPPSNLDPSVNPPLYPSRSHHCQVIVQDFFGTSANAVFMHRNHTLSHILAAFRYTDLPGGQSGSGFLATPEPRPWTLQRGERKKRILVWGKKAHYFAQTSNTHVSSNINLFRILHAHFTDGVIVSMADGEFSQVPHELKQFIARNLGPMSHANYVNELRECQVIIGLGDPHDGPSPIEAMSYQTVYINPRLMPVSGQHPHSKVQNRKYSSQHVYVEQMIPPPLAYTIDIHDEVILRQTLKEIDARSTEQLPHLPSDFYARGNVHAMGLHLQTIRPTCDPLSSYPFIEAPDKRSWSEADRKAWAERLGKKWE